MRAVVVYRVIKIKVFISGDFCPILEAEECLLDGKSLENVFVDFKAVIEDSDVSITNLECPLTFADEPVDKIGANLKANPGVAKTLKKAGFDLVTLANNHIYDYGQRGLQDTCESLNKHGLSFVGVGKTLQESQKVFYKDVKGVKIAFVNFADVEFSCANEKGDITFSSVILATEELMMLQLLLAWQKKLLLSSRCPTIRLFSLSLSFDFCRNPCCEYA